jgi:hypothetical protein
MWRTIAWAASIVVAIGGGVFIVAATRGRRGGSEGLEQGVGMSRMMSSLFHRTIQPRVP